MDDVERVNDFSSMAAYKKNNRAKLYLQGMHNDSIVRLDFVPRINKKDVDNGSIFRYFASPTNQSNGEIVEVSHQQFLNLKTVPLYTCVIVPWKIRGTSADVESANTLAIKDAETEVGGIKLKLNNIKQFYQGI